LTSYPTDSSYCPTCGLALVPGASHCARCGTPLYGYAPKNQGHDQAGMSPTPGRPGNTPPPTPPNFGAPSPSPAFPPGTTHPYAPGGWPASPPAPKSNTGLIIGTTIAVVLILVSGGIGGWWILAQDDSGQRTSQTDDPTSAADSNDGDSSSSTDPKDGTRARKEAAAQDMTEAFASVSTGDPGAKWCSHAYAYASDAVYTDESDCLAREAVVMYFEDYAEYIDLFSRFEAPASALTVIDSDTLRLRVSDWRTPDDCNLFCEGMEDSTVVHYLQKIPGEGWRIVGRETDSGEEGYIPISSNETSV
jgi:hypothetical protein